jgi:hypothetical protein
VLVLHEKSGILWSMTATPGERTTTGWVPVLDDSTFGARLVLIRYKKRWPGHKRAAEETGFRTATWQSWEERPGTRPRDYEEVVAQISRKSGCDAGWLYGGKPMEGMIDLDQLEEGLARGLEGPAALALSLRSDTEREKAPTAAIRSEAVLPNSRYLADADRPVTNPANRYPSGPARPAGRPQTDQTSLTGPKPVRPTRLRHSAGR